MRSVGVPSVGLFTRKSSKNFLIGNVQRHRLPLLFRSQALYFNLGRIESQGKQARPPSRDQQPASATAQGHALASPLRVWRTDKCPRAEARRHLGVCVD
jgi:hypothetical protein